MSVNKQTITVEVDLQAKLDNLERAMKQAQKSISGLSLGKGLTTSFTNAFTTIETEIAKIRDKTEGGKINVVDEKAIQTSLMNIEKKWNSILKNAGNLNFDTTKLKADKEVFNTLKNGIEKYKQEVKKANDEQEVFKNTLKSLRESTALKNAGIDLNGIKDFKQLEEFFINFTNTATVNLGKVKKEILSFGTEGKTSLKGLRDEIKDTETSLEQMTQKAKDIDALKQRLAYFFGINNAIALFRRGLRNAYNAVKELDAAMTETAVVTDFTVGDMWDQLPKYTDMANKFGVSIKGVYEASTLYYQQGLKTNEVMELTAETLKMARIAGLEYAEATNFMTAALRGFNMEINEESAQRVNDVYSKLAAITAANTEEIATAMTKTASIASNANMEIETTAAFLSQIIETTRESAETAGTAMKTVIARFQELKKDPSEIGEVDGEIVDANKIEGALRTVGVALRDANGQFRDLDDVFLELSRKWRTLDTNTQRYIATIAAGSRQQSRFIAMMSDYERTMELVSAANNSAGASQEQFEKTLDSLESKLAKLNNTWNEFTLGVLNNEAIKTGVVALTTMLDTVNKLTSGFGSFGSTLLKVGAAFLAFKGGGVVLNSITKGLFGTEILKGSAIKGSLLPQKIEPQKVFDRDAFAEYIKNNKNSKQITTRINPKASAGYKNNDFTQSKGYAIQLAKEGKINKTPEQVEEDFKSFDKTINSGTIALQKFSAAATIAGLAFSKFGQYLKDNGKEELGEAVTGFGNALMGVGTILSVVLPSLAASGSKAITTSILGIPIIGWIAGIGVAVYGVFKLIDAFVESEEERVERLNKQLKESQDRAAKLNNEISELGSTLEQLEEGEEVLKTLVKGSEAWKNKVEEINNSILSLVDTYPQLKKFLELGSDGVYRWSDEGEASRELERIKRNERNLSEVETISNKKQLQSREVDLYYEETYYKRQGNKEVKETRLEEVKLSQDDLRALSKAYSENSALFNLSAEDLKGIDGLKNLPQEFFDNLDNFEDSLIQDTLIPVLEDTIESENFLANSLNNLKTQNLIDNVGIDSYEHSDIVANRMLHDDSKDDPYREKYRENSAIEEAIREELEEQGITVTEINFNDETGKITYSGTKEDGEEKSGSYDKETWIEYQAHEDYTKSEEAKKDAENYEKQTQEEIAELTGYFTNSLPISELDAENMATDLVAAAAEVGAITADGKIDWTNERIVDELLGKLPIRYLQLLQNSSIDLDGDEKSTVYNDALAAALEAQKEANKKETKDSTEFTRQSDVNSALNNISTAMELQDDQIQALLKAIQEEYGIGLEEAKQKLLVDLNFEYADEQIDEIYEEVMSAFKLEDSDPKKVEALKGLVEPLKRILGNEKIDLDFVIQNQKEIEAFLNGSSEALNKLQEASFMEILISADTGLAEEELSGLFEEFSNLEVGVSLGVDESKLLQTINYGLSEGLLSLEDVYMPLLLMGYMPTIEDDINPFAKDENGQWTTTIGEKHITSLTKFSDGTTKKYTPPEDKDSPWENPYDKYYNTLQKIADLQHERSLIEAEIAKIEAYGADSAEKTANLYKKQLEYLREEKYLADQMAKNRTAQMIQKLEEAPDIVKQNVEYDAKQNLIGLIDWDALNALKDSEKGEEIEKYVDALEGWQKDNNSYLEDVIKLETDIKNLQTDLRDKYIKLQERTAEALETQMQREVDELEKVYNAVNEANEDLTDAIDKNINKLRQDRDNEKAEEDISEKERRLAYLRQDTSGANAMQIRQLEDEIEQAKQEYEDNLIDQALESLQEQNEHAAEQRDQEISLMNEQINYMKESGEYARQAKEILDNCIDSGGSASVEDSQLYELLSKVDRADNMTQDQFNAWRDELVKQIKGAESYDEVKKDEEAYQADLLSKDWSLEIAKVYASNGGNWNDPVIQNLLRQRADAVEAKKAITPNWNPDWDTLTEEDVKRIIREHGIGSSGASGGAAPLEQKGEQYDPVTVSSGDNLTKLAKDNNATINDFYRKDKNGNYDHLTGDERNHIKAGETLWIKRYKTGGVADFTGPAWLDGTKSRPEIILNQQDSQTFLAFTNTLQSLAHMRPSAMNASGDNYFDIAIQVDKIDNDYDVDQLASRIKHIIYEDATYRNVNSINLLR